MEHDHSKLMEWVIGFLMVVLAILKGGGTI